MIDYATKYADVYAVGANDTGVLARVNSVFLREQLGNTAGRVLPWLVWQYAGVQGERGQMSDVAARWWIYIPPAEAPRKLYQIATALEEAYTNIFSVSWGRIVMGKPSAPFIDKALNNLQGISVPVTYRALG